MRLMTSVITAFALTGCVAHFDMLRQAEPNPFSGRTHINIAKPDFGKALIDGHPVADWAASADQARDWPLNQVNAVKEFYDQIEQKRGSLSVATSGQPSGDEILIVPSIERLQPGYYIGIAAQPTTIILHATVFVNGAPADEVLFHDEVVASLYKPSFNQRLADSMRNLADELIAYVQWRTAPAK